MKKKRATYKFEFFKGKAIKNFSVFLIAAFSFLLLTKLSNNYTEKLVFKVNLSNLKDEIVVLDDSSNTIEVFVKSKGFNLLKYTFYNPKPILLDGNKDVIKKGKTMSWGALKNLHVIRENLGESFDIISITPDTLTFNFDILETKQVPIIFNNEINYALGYNVLGEIELSNDSVKLIGSQSHLKTISEIATNTLQLSEVKENIDQTLGLKLPENSNIKIVPEEVNVKGVVKRFTEGNISVPIELINVPIGVKLNYFPKEVELSYYVDLEAYSSVKASDFKIVCDYKDLKDEEQRFLAIEISETSNLVKSTRLKQNRIQFIILK
ncbi:CdaR family protein [Winogradskyella immobilis]|uniref:YbbR-like domain-containing protein n=1 Tax=Winogradskyella immobilis TaxID=2816852 RepID=A0ABS8EPM1_9FLAO|nr:YbbR-like domain-containing protein [Winogradskyella immobilis]MCC1484807.1 YbbR-like domain-containing protein [Winogradskyella immobilis]MCG0016899.1 YbbR-like domain-containing protein [Winogradskyella immobilis]